MDTNELYDRLAVLYHLIFSDWNDVIKKGADNLHKIISENSTAPVKSILDVSCGIGTQIIGLAEIGYDVTGSDLSAASIQRARSEMELRGLSVNLSVADMRQAYRHHKQQYDAVISCHNSVTHLQDDDEILKAFQEFYDCVRRGGICLINVRDYDNEKRGGVKGAALEFMNDYNVNTLLVNSKIGEEKKLMSIYTDPRGLGIMQKS